MYALTIPQQETLPLPIDNTPVSGSQLLVRATQIFLQLCEYLDTLSRALTPKDWKRECAALGLQVTLANQYVKIMDWMHGIPLQNLYLIDVKTLITLCASKYSPILEKLKKVALSAMEVKELMSDINKELVRARKKNKPAEQDISWQKDTLVAKVNKETGTKLEETFKQSKKQSLSEFVAELLSKPDLKIELDAPVVYNSQLTDTAPATDRWKQGWQAGDVVVPNDAMPVQARQWFLGSEAEVVNVGGAVGTIQMLTLKRKDGAVRRLMYGNWIEEAGVKTNGNSSYTWGMAS